MQRLSSIALLLLFLTSPVTAQAAGDRATVLRLDRSGSVWARLPEGQSPVEVARDGLDDVLRGHAMDAPLGDVAHGHSRNDDRVEVWKDGQLQGWDRSLHVWQMTDNSSGPAAPLMPPSDPGADDLLYLSRGMDGTEAIATRQPLRIWRVELKEDAVTIGEAPCEPTAGDCAAAEERPLPGSGVVPVRIVAEGLPDLPVDWTAVPIDRPGDLSLASGGAVAGGWTTALDIGPWAVTGIAEGATFFARIEVTEGGPTDMVIARDTPGEVESEDGMGQSAIDFRCEQPLQCAFEDTEVGILSIIPEGWAVDEPTRAAATVGGQGGSVRMMIFDPARPEDALILNPHQWIAMNGPCIEVQPGLLCHFEPASPALLQALDDVRRSIRDTAPGSPSPLSRP